MTSKAKRPRILQYNSAHAATYETGESNMKLALVDVGIVISRMGILCPRYDLEQVKDVMLYEYDARGKTMYRNGLLLEYIFKGYAEEQPPKIQVVIPEFANENDRTGHFVQISLVNVGERYPRRTTMVSLNDDKHPSWSFNSEISSILLAYPPSTSTKETPSIEPTF